jgi:hypothetical protein
LTESTVRKKLSLLPVGTAPGTGEEERVEVEVEFGVCLGVIITLTILMSTRQEPIASAVYLQKIGITEVEESRRDRGASEIRAFPTKEYYGGGEL